MKFVKKGIFNQPDEFAKLMYETSGDFFSKMSAEEFECWLKDEIKKPYVRIGTQEIAIADEFKKAMYYYLGFLYYSAILEK